MKNDGEDKHNGIGAARTRGNAFAIGTFTAPGVAVFPGLVLDDHVAHLGRLKQVVSILALLEDWERSLDMLCGAAETLRRDGLDSEKHASVLFELGALTSRPPVLRPGKMVYAGQNYADHVAEMRRTQFGGTDYDTSKDFKGEKQQTEPYSFLKAPSCLCGATDDIVLPADRTDFDWEVEMALAIGRPGRRIRAERALEHIAGFMTTNDVSCRSAQWRPDRPRIRSDWIGGKCYDTFAPMGPLLVPKMFVADHMNLRLTLSVNGSTMQDGCTAGLIFTPEEQIEYFSRGMTLEPGDIFATGTPGGVGQGRGQFLKPGDIVECEVEGLGRQCNRVVGEPGTFASHNERG